jgi:hypothetical protein
MGVMCGEALFDCLHPLRPVKVDSCPRTGHNTQSEWRRTSLFSVCSGESGCDERSADWRFVEKSAWISGLWSRSLVSWQMVGQPMMSWRVCGRRPLHSWIASKLVEQ